MTSSEDWRGKKCQFAWRTWSNAAPFKDVRHDNETGFGNKPFILHVHSLTLTWGFVLQAFVVSWTLKKYCRLSLCFAVCWRNWTANQSCFSSLALLFRSRTGGGRCLECKSTKGMFAADFSAEMVEKKTEECKKQGILTESGVSAAPAATWFTHFYNFQ